jgi:putative ubiquitin-RnfH superfamily antitoxin RatB of RatAB toxin-antitoxin module
MITVELIFADKDVIYQQIATFKFAPQVFAALSIVPWAAAACQSHAPPALEISIWGQAVTLETFLKNGDRVEITRPILIDPKRARAHRVAIKPRQGWMRRWRKSTADAPPMA